MWWTIKKNLNIDAGACPHDAKKCAHSALPCLLQGSSVPLFSKKKPPLQGSGPSASAQSRKKMELTSCRQNIFCRTKKFSKIFLPAGLFRSVAGRGLYKKTALPLQTMLSSLRKRRSVRWHTAMARASVVSRGPSMCARPRSRATMKATCSFSARPVPASVFFTSVGS